MNNFKISGGSEGTRITDVKHRYSLIIPNSPNSSELGDIYFYIPSFCVIDKHTSIPITARGLKDYPIQKNKINPKLQYLDIGAGYAEFTPYLTSLNPTKKPIVIEPANLDLTGRLLLFAKSNLCDKDQLSKIERLIQRHNILIDSSKVRLINHTLGKAIKEFPDLREIADRVLDRAGPLVYLETEMVMGEQFSHLPLKQRVLEMELYLLKDGGELLSFS